MPVGRSKMRGFFAALRMTALRGGEDTGCGGFGDGVDGGGGVLRCAVEGEAGGEEGAGGVLAGVDGGAVEDYGSDEAVLGGDCEVVGGGLSAFDGDGGGEATVDGQGEGSAGLSGSGEGDGGGGGLVGAGDGEGAVGEPTAMVPKL